MASRIPSPARSLGAPSTPRRYRTRGSRSVGSPARSDVPAKPSTIAESLKDLKASEDSFVLTPLSRKSVLTDNTGVEELRRKSWWKKLDDTSLQLAEFLHTDNLNDPNDVEEFANIEVPSLIGKNLSLNLPESSGNESIASIVLPQRRLFTQVENMPRKKFDAVVGPMESMVKPQKSTNTEKTDDLGLKKLAMQPPPQRSRPAFPSGLISATPNKTAYNDESMEVAPKKLFGQGQQKMDSKKLFTKTLLETSSVKVDNKETEIAGRKALFNKDQQLKVKPMFPPELLNVSPDETAPNNTKLASEVQRPAYSLFGNRAGTKRKNMFADLIVSESEDEIQDIQPKVFGFPKRTGSMDPPSRRRSSASKGVNDFPLSTTNDIDLDDWKMLPSSTMMVDQLEDMVSATPTKKMRLSDREESGKELGVVEKSQMEHQEETEPMVEESVEQIRKELELGLEEEGEKEPSIVEQNQMEHREEEPEPVVEESVEQIQKELELGEEAEGVKEHNDLEQKQIEHQVEVDQNIELKQSKESVEQNIEDKEDVEMDHEEIGQEAGQNELTLELEQGKQRMCLNEHEDRKNDVEVSHKETGEEVEIVHSEKGNEFLEIDHEEHDQEADQAEAHVELYQGQEIICHNEDEDNEEHAELRYEDKDGEEEIKHNENDNDDVEVCNEDLSAQEADQNEVTVEPEQGKNVINDSKNDNKGGKVSHEENDKEAEMVHNEEENLKVDYKEHCEDEEDLKVSREEKDEEEEIVHNDKNKECVEMDHEEHYQEANQNKVTVEHKQGEKSIHHNDDEEEVEVRHEEEHIEHNRRDEEDVEVDHEEEGQEAGQNEINLELSHGQKIIDPNEDEDIEENLEVSHEEKDEEEEIEHDENHAELEQTEEEIEQEDSEAEQSIEETLPEEHDYDRNESEIEEESREEIEQDDEAEEEGQDEETDDNIEQNSHAETAEHLSTSEQTEETQESPNSTHDTTGRNRKKIDNDIVKIPEAILKGTTSQNTSLKLKGRNTSIRKTKSMIRPSVNQPSIAASVRDSIGTNGSNSTDQGSGWDSHRTTRKTLRLTFGKDFTPRKSLRALVMEKSAQRRTLGNVEVDVTKGPQANSTEINVHEQMSMVADNVEDSVEDTASDHDISRKTRQTTLEMYLQKVKKDTLERKMRMEIAVRESLKAPSTNVVDQFNFKLPSKLGSGARKISKPSAQPRNAKRPAIQLGMLQSELLEDMKYKPPKRFMPNNASWTTKRLYKFLESKLEPRYDYKARVRAEKLVETLYTFSKLIQRCEVAPRDAIDELKVELARLNVTRTHFDFYNFFQDFMPREMVIKVVPDLQNKLPMPKYGLYSDIIRETNQA